MFNTIDPETKQTAWRIARAPSALLPELPCRAAEAEVWIDFDGTITCLDVLDELIRVFARSDRWRETEARWMAGEIGSFECLQDEFDVLAVDEPTLSAFLETIPIDPGACRLFTVLRQYGVPFTVLSDGIESFINLVVERGRLGSVGIRANRVRHVDQRLHLLCPHRYSACESQAAHCKCRSAEVLSRGGLRSIYIGDGRSDLCPARKADIVFAKGALAQLLFNEGRPFYRFDTLDDIADVLTTAWEAP